MPSGLFLLLRLRFLGWLRRLGRGMRTVRGALLIVVGGLVVLLWVGPAFFQGPGDSEDLATVRQFGPWVLLGFCLINLLFTTNERALLFNPAEVNFLFAAPVSRRQLLLYKITGNLAALLLTALFMMLILRRQTAMMLAGVIGAFLIFLFMQLFAIALSLIANIVGVKAYNRQRRILLLVFAAVLGIALYQQNVQLQIRNIGQVLRDLEKTPVFHVMLTPMHWFVDLLTAENLWPDLVSYAGLALAVNLVLFGLIFILDAHYLEAAAAASEKLYALMKRMQKGGFTAASSTAKGRKIRRQLPSLPFWGGVGPIVWRQLTSAFRSLRQLLFILVFVAIVFLPMLMRFSGGADHRAVLAVAPAMMIVLTMFGSGLLPFDFRSDIDRMDVIKSLPVPSWRLALGQLLTPVMMLTVAQTMIVLLLQTVAGHFSAYLTAGMLFFLPVNMLFIALDNLMFLWFPTRQMTATPGDFQMMGRMIVVWLAKMIAFFIVLTPAAIAGAICYFIVGENWWVIGATVWLVMMAAVAAMMPLVGLAFRTYDVAQDTPGM